MALLTAQSPTLTGPTFTPGAANGGGDSFANSGTEFFYIKNAGVGSINVTFDAPGTCNFGLPNNAAHDDVVAVGAGVERIIGPFPVGRFNDTNNQVQVTYSGVTSVTVAVLKAA